MLWPIHRKGVSTERYRRSQDESHTDDYEIDYFQEIKKCDCISVFPGSLQADL